MSTIHEIPYTGKQHGDFDLEWLSHDQSSEWWYATGILEDASKHLYSYQFVIIKNHLKVMEFWSMQLALTDFESGKHYYFEEKAKGPNSIIINESSAIFGNSASVIKSETGMRVIGTADEFEFDINCEYGKGAFWHCDNGYLLMGTPDTPESTLYFSYPNMPSTGTIKIADKTFSATGKTWFDKQGGPFNQMAVETHWEWFSFRFFDNEEVMLFSFPQNDYYDGTYIKDNAAQRLNNYTVKTTDVISIDGLEFSSAWDIFLPGIKEEHYYLEPLLDCQRNGNYFELVAKVRNASNEHVGYCVVELLPGVRNKDHIGEMAKSLQSAGTARGK